MMLRFHHPISTAILLFLFMLTGMLPAEAQNNGQDGRGLKILPISDLMFRAASPQPPRLGPLTRRPKDVEAPFQWMLAEREFVCIPQDELLDLVRSSSGDASEEVSMVVRGQTLLISGAEKHVTKVEQTVNSLRRAIAMRFSVRGRLYRISSTSTYPASASAARLVELTRDLPLVWSGHTTTYSGQQVVLAQEKFTRYVSDVDVEVAEEESIGRPITSAMFEGVRLLVESHALIGTSDRVFKCQFAIGEQDGGIVLQSTGVQGLPAIGVPRLRANSGAFSGRVTHEGALLVTLQSRDGAGSNLLLVVQAGTIGGPSPTEISAGRTMLLPISALTSPSLQFDLPFSRSESDPEQTHGGYSEMNFEEEDQNDRGETLLSLLRESLGSLLEEEDAAVDLTSNGFGHGFVLVRGSEKTRTEARRLLATMQDQWIRAVEVSVRTDLRRVEQTSSTFSTIRSSAKPIAGPTIETDGEILHSVTFPVLVGDCVVIFKGVESSVVRDSNVEIANKTSMSNPVVQTTFSGVTIGVRPNLQGNNFGADLRVDLNHIPPPLRQPTSQGNGCDLYLVNVNKAHFRQSGAVTLAKPVSLGWGPQLGGRQKALRMHQTVRFRKL